MSPWVDRRSRKPERVQPYQGAKPDSPSPDTQQKAAMERAVVLPTSPPLLHIPESPPLPPPPPPSPKSPMRRIPSTQLLLASDMMKSAAAPLRNVVGSAAGVMGWAAMRIMPTAVPIVKAQAEDTSPGCIPVELKLLNGLGLHIEVSLNMTVEEFREHVRQAVGLSPQQQVFVIAEDRARLGGIGKLAKRMHRSIATTRQDLRSAVISWVNFVFLPEVFNRELYGRGLISWAKGSSWYQSLQEAQNRCAAAAAASSDNSMGPAKVQVEQLSGQVLLMEADVDASLGALKAAIEKQLGIMADQQRLIVLERKGPGRLVNLTNMLLLHSFAGLKTAVGAAAWAGASLLGKTDERFPIYLRTTAGRPFTMTVTGDTTINQVRIMLEDQEELEPEEDVQGITFPPQLPTIRAPLPQTHIIRTVAA